MSRRSAVVYARSPRLSTHLQQVPLLLTWDPLGLRNSTQHLPIKAVPGFIRSGAPIVPSSTQLLRLHLPPVVTSCPDSPTDGMPLPPARAPATPPCHGTSAATPSSRPPQATPPPSTPTLRDPAPSQTRPLISPPAVRRSGPQALRRLPAMPELPCAEPLCKPTPQPLPVGPPPPCPDRAAMPRQLVTPPAVADPIPPRRAR